MIKFILQKMCKHNSIMHIRDLNEGLFITFVDGVRVGSKWMCCDCGKTIYRKDKIL